MATTMQDKILSALIAAIEGQGAEAVTTTTWGNVGSIYAQRGFATQVVIEYQFNPDYCTIVLSGAEVEAAIKNNDIDTATVQCALSEWKVHFHALAYTEGERIGWLVAMVSDLSRETPT